MDIQFIIDNIYKNGNNEKLKKQFYGELFAKLIKNREAKFENFVDYCEKLRAKKELILEKIKSFEYYLDKKDYLDIGKLFNIYIDSDFIEINKFIFIRRDYLETYLEKNENISIKNKGDFYNFYDFELRKSSDYIYLLVKNSYYDRKQYIPVIQKEIQGLSLALMYVIGTKVNIVQDYNLNFNNYFQVNKENNRIEIDNYMGDFDNSYNLEQLVSNKFENKKIIEIFSKNINDMTEIELRIYFAVRWVSSAFLEQYDYIKITMISFAFEVLLKEENEKLFNQGVVNNLSERYAFINGNNFDERINYKNEFKNFYSERSKIVHGYSKIKNELNIDEYFIMIKNTIKNFIVKNKFFNCRTNEELKNVFDHMKYD